MARNPHMHEHLIIWWCVVTPLIHSFRSAPAEAWVSAKKRGLCPDNEAKQYTPWLSLDSCSSIRELPIDGPHGSQPETTEQGS